MRARFSITAAFQKAVFAAVAYSHTARIIETSEPGAVEAAFGAEWQTLYDNGIVPQPPLVYIERSKPGEEEQAG